jgi:N-acyl-D-amino-acid deacylase
MTSSRYIIRNGTLIDGSGAPPIRADISIRGNTIETIGTIGADPNAVTIDAKDAFIAPGFIDVHSHSDAYILIEPTAASKAHQGITTEIVGQCGASAAPIAGNYKMPSDWREMTFPGTWNTLLEYRELLQKQAPAVNIAMLTGHNTLRAGVIGYQPRPATADEIRHMQDRLEECLQTGSRGLSTGLLYPPGKHAQIDEVIQLCRTVARHNGIYATHMRSEGDRLIESLQETLHIARESGVRLQISHLKTSGRANWQKLDQALEIIQQARDQGLHIMADRYPYTAACTDLDVLLPDWVFANGPQHELEWLKDPARQQQIREEVSAQRAPDYWETVRIGSTFHPENRRFQGRPLLEAARQLGLNPVDTVIHLLLTDRIKTGGIFFGMSEENMWRILSQPFVMLGSDASLRAPIGPLSHDHPHPRAYGAFAKFLRAALTGNTVPLHQAIHKMTGLPARQFNLEKRGLLRKGYAADITLFTPDTTDHATYEKPHTPATGMRAVFVNGTPILLNDHLTGKRGGCFI